MSRQGSIACSVYRSARRDEMYLYVADAAEPGDLPDPLVAEFLGADPVLRLQLDPGRRLARASAPAVIEALRKHGYYLQMPPNNDIAGLAIDRNNDKLPRAR